MAALLLQVADCQVKLQRADKLIGGLGGERTRWAATVQQLQSDLHNVVGDVVLAAGEQGRVHLAAGNTQIIAPQSGVLVHVCPLHTVLAQQRALLSVL